MLCRRVHDLATRGIASPGSLSFEDLYRERTALYARYADVTVDCGEMAHEGVCRAILEQLNETHHPDVRPETP